MLWRLAEPEVAVVEELEFVLLIENGFVLASTLSVVAPDADIVVAIKGSLQVLQLGPEHLLRSENDRSHEVHLVAHDLAAFGPDLAVDAVVGVFVADVIGADEHFLGREVKGSHNEGKEKEFFHLRLYYVIEKMLD